MKIETEWEKRRGAFFEACQVYNRPNWRASEAAGQIRQDLDFTKLGLELIIQIRASWTEWKIVHNESFLGPYQNFTANQPKQYCITINNRRGYIYIYIKKIWVTYYIRSTERSKNKKGY